MKTTITVIFLYFLVSCSSDSKEKRQNNFKDTLSIEEVEEITEPQFITDPNQKGIISISDTLYKGDSLKIKFKMPHSGDFAIATPDSIFFFLSIDTSFIKYDKFLKTENLEIITNKTKAIPYVYNATEKILIFNKTGKYEISLSENLDTDDGTPVEIENVYYFDKEK